MKQEEEESKKRLLDAHRGGSRKLLDCEVDKGMLIGDDRATRLVRCMIDELNELDDMRRD
jgi:hypothetical protein